MKGFHVKLSKRSMIHIYAIIRQAELSVDAALKLPWEEFLEFYSKERAEAVSETINFLEDLVYKTGDNSFSSVSRRRRWQRWLLGLAFRWSSVVPVSPRQLHFIRMCIHSFGELLKLEDKPVNEVIIQVRMRLSECESLIEDLIGVGPEVRRAMRVEHLSNVTFRTHYSLGDFLIRAIRSGPMNISDDGGNHGHTK